VPWSNVKLVESSFCFSLQMEDSSLEHDLTLTLLLLQIEEARLITELLSSKRKGELTSDEFSFYFHRLQDSQDEETILLLQRVEKCATDAKKNDEKTGKFIDFNCTMFS